VRIISKEATVDSCEYAITVLSPEALLHVNAVSSHCEY